MKGREADATASDLLHGGESAVQREDVQKVVNRPCWCGAKTALRVGEFESGFSLVECPNCQVCALHPQPSDDQLAEAYAADYYGSSRRKFIAPIAALISLFQGGRARQIERRIAPASAILDVGCGNGGFLMQMKSRGHAVQGTEWTADSAKRVPADADIAVHVGDLIDIPLQSASFDAITLWHVFEHLRQPRETLMKIRTLLKHDGVLVMSMPNVESAQAKRYGTHWFHHDPPRHLFGFGPHSITLLLEDSGFKVDRIRTWSIEQNPFGEIQSMLNSRIAWRDRLYALLKGTARPSLAAAIDDLSSLAAYAPIAIAREIFESSRGEGATMTIEASLVS